MADKITLYDIPCKGKCAGWSGNVWKTRMALHFKDIPYRTIWVEHPQITPTMEKLGLQPGSGPMSPYTVPAIVLPDGTAVMDSFAIAQKLESLHPSPSLHLDNGLPEKFDPIYRKIGMPLIPVFMPRVARDVLLESSVPWFREARAKAFGMELDELEKQKGGEQAWEAARPGLDELSKFVVEFKCDEGPFVLGSQVSYVDFMIASLLESFRRIGEDLYERLVGHDDNFRRLHEACQKWMKYDQ